MALTLRPLDANGAFALVEDDEGIVGYGMARVSKARPGYVTLVTNEAPLGRAIRVPINWIEELQQLPRSLHDV